MSGIKTTTADKWFSLCVRERVNYTCERCGTFAPPDLHKRLDCSHFHGRGKWSVRFDPENCFALCMGCHRYVSANPMEHSEWVMEQLGPYRFDALRERLNDKSLGHRYKREQAAIAKHYREELKNLRSQRTATEGRIEFVGY